MEKLIYKFLDVHFGNEIVVKKRHIFSKPEYLICSPKGGVILSFIVHDDYTEEQGGERISIIGRNSVYEMLMGFFSIEKQNAMGYLRNWFGDKHDLKKVGDLKKFIPHSSK